MTLTPSATPDVLPRKFPSGLRLTPEQFELVCAENREAVLELAADGRVIAMSPTCSETSGRNSELLFQLQQYAKASGDWKVDPSNSLTSAELMITEMANALRRRQRDLGMVRATPHMVCERAFSARFPAHSRTGSPQPERAVQPPAANGAISAPGPARAAAQLCRGYGESMQEDSITMTSAHRSTQSDTQHQPGAVAESFTYWRESDGHFLGYLNAYPDHWTQGEDLEDLKAQLLDLYHEFSKQDLPGIRKIGELVVT